MLFNEKKRNILVILLPEKFRKFTEIFLTVQDAAFLERKLVTIIIYTL